MSEIYQWYHIVCFSQKMISAKTWYETHNQKLMINIEVFKTQCYNLESFKYQVLIFIYHTNFQKFINTKSLIFIYVCQTLKLFKYHFYIDYLWKMASIATNVLSLFSKRSQSEKLTIKMRIAKFFIIYKIYQYI